MSSRSKFLPLIAVSVLVLASLAEPANAQSRFADLPAAEAYRACLAYAQKSPENGFEAAITWRDEGGGPAARHCVAMALVYLGQHSDAALRLETLAGEMTHFEAIERAAVLGQAARVWYRAGNPERAEAAVSAAIILAPSDAELRVDRGEILASTGQYWEAIDDFNAAIDAMPNDIDALIFRGTTYRLLDVADLARQDLEDALRNDPDNPEALVELGAVDLMEKHPDAARQRWLRAISVAPASPAADAARNRLERLDVKIE